MSYIVIKYKLYKKKGDESTECDLHIGGNNWTQIPAPIEEDLELIDFRENLKTLKSQLPSDLMKFLENKQHGEVEWLSNTKGTIFEISTCGENMILNLDEKISQIIELKNQGNVFINNSKYREALALYDQALSLDIDRVNVIVPVLLNKALAHLKLEEFGKSIEASTRVLTLDPNNIKALFRRGVAKIENRDFSSAKRDLLSAQFIDKTDANILKKLREIEFFESGRLSSDNILVNNESSICDEKYAELHIAGGVVRIRLFTKECPKTVENFIQNSPKYAQCVFFKIVKNQFAQTGDYEYNDGSGGNMFNKSGVNVFDRNFLEDENLTLKHTKRGLVGMANYGPNTNGSQFYITLGECPWMDEKHVIFGEVVEDEKHILDLINIAGSEPSQGSFSLDSIILDQVVVT